MALLIFFVVLFAIAHVTPAIGDVKPRLKQALGKTYGPLYGVLSLLLLAGALWAYRQSEPGWIYDVPSWGRHANFGITLLAFICFGIFLFRGSWRQTLRYPMAIAVLLWATGHLLANGDGKSLVFFGGLAVAAVLHAILLARGPQPVREPARDGHNFLSVMAGIALYALMTQIHYVVTGAQLLELH